MSEYADIKAKKFRRVLSTLLKISDINLRETGSHTCVKCIRTGETYPIPTSHRSVNRFIVKGFKDWLVRNKICSAVEFNNLLKK